MQFELDSGGGSGWYSRSREFDMDEDAMVQAAEQAYRAALTASETYGRSRVAVAAATAQDNAEALTEQHARALEVLDKKEAKATAAHTAG